MKLLGKESFVEEFDEHVKESKASFREILERIVQLNRWKDNFNEVFSKSMEDLNRRVEDCVLKGELSRYNEELIGIIDLKMGEQKSELAEVGRKVKDVEYLEEKVTDLSTKLTKIKTRMDLLEGSVKDSAKRVDEEALKEYENEQREKQSEVVNSKIEAVENELREVKRLCANLKAKNEELEREMQEMKEEPSRREDIRAELLTKIEELRAEMQNDDYNKIDNVEHVPQPATINRRSEEFEHQVHTEIIDNKPSTQEPFNLIEERSHITNPKTSILDAKECIDNKEDSEDDLMVREVENKDEIDQNVQDKEHEGPQDDVENFDDLPDAEEIKNQELSANSANSEKEDQADHDSNVVEAVKDAAVDEAANREENKEEVDSSNDIENPSDKEELRSPKTAEGQIEGLGEALLDDMSDVDTDNLVNDLPDVDNAEEAANAEGKKDGEEPSVSDKGEARQSKELKDIAEGSDDDWFK